MHRYTTSVVIGEGSYGCVLRATARQTGKTVAIKKITHAKFYTLQQCLLVREVQALRRLRHPNIVGLQELIRDQDVLYLVLEFVDTTLHQWLKKQPEPPPEPTVRAVARRLMLGLRHMHERGFVHRDVKPQNILVSDDMRDLKLCDFGVARQLPRRPSSDDKELTAYVATRWYRAPELLLQAPAYSAPVDVWAAGAIVGELFTRQPLFPGASEADQLDRITALLGPPQDHAFGAASWRQGLALIGAQDRSFPAYAPTPMAHAVPQASPEAAELLAALLRWDPSRRWTASQSLRHACLRPPQAARGAAACGPRFGCLGRRAPSGVDGSECVDVS